MAVAVKGVNHGKIQIYNKESLFLSGDASQYPPRHRRIDHDRYDTYRILFIDREHKQL